MVSTLEKRNRNVVEKRSLYPNKAKLVFNLVSRILSLPPSKMSFVDGGREQILLIRLLIIEAVTSRFVDVAVKRLRNCERKERRVGRVTHRMMKKNFYK